MLQDDITIVLGDLHAIMGSDNTLLKPGMGSTVLDIVNTVTRGVRLCAAATVSPLLVLYIAGAHSLP